MLTDTAVPPTVTAQANFLSRSGQKFFFKAMRLPEVGASLDFSQKLALRHRLEELKLAHTTGLIVTEAQSQPVPGYRGAGGNCRDARVAIRPPICSTDGDGERRFRASRIPRRFISGHRALSAYIIDCPISQDELRAGCLENARPDARVAKRDQTPRPARDGRVKLRPATRALILARGGFPVCRIAGARTGRTARFRHRLHNLAEARPVVVEFREASPDQDHAVTMAFGTGAAGVVAPLVPAPVAHDWLGIRMLRAAELMPFVTLNGSCPPQPHCPMVSVVICAYNAERTMRPCLESLRRLAYPNYEVVIVDDGSAIRPRKSRRTFRSSG